MLNQQDEQRITDLCRQHNILYNGKKNEWTIGGNKNQESVISALLQIDISNMHYVKTLLSGNDNSLKMSYKKIILDDMEVSDYNDEDEHFLNRFQLAFNVIDFNSVLIISNDTNRILVLAKEGSKEYPILVQNAMVQLGIWDSYMKEIESYNDRLNEILKGKSLITLEETREIMNKFPTCLFRIASIGYIRETVNTSIPTEYRFYRKGNPLRADDVLEHIPLFLKNIGKPAIDFNKIPLFSNDLSEISMRKIDIYGILAKGGFKKTYS